MRRVVLVVALVALTACSPSGGTYECRPAEGGIGGTGQPAECLE